jgi:hypothetical protein
MRPGAVRLFTALAILWMLIGAPSPVEAAPAASAGTQAESAALDEAAYWDLLRRSRADIVNLKDRPEQEIKDGLTALAVEWEAVTSVRGADGGLIPVDNGYLTSALRAIPPQSSKIIQILDALLAAHDENPGQVYSTADLYPLHMILAQPEFAWSETPPNPVTAWFQKLVDRLNQWLNSLMGDRVVTINLGSPLVTWTSTALLLVILFFVFNTIFADFVRDARLAANKNGENEPLSAESAFERAQTLSRGGDYRSAVRYLYLSSLLALDERGLLRYDRSKTNREYLRSVADTPELSEPLEEVIEVFDDVWYGYHALEEKSFQHYSDRVRQLKETKG